MMRGANGKRFAVDEHLDEMAPRASIRVVWTAKDRGARARGGGPSLEPRLV
jgi:hypothetical protein